MYVAPVAPGTKLRAVTKDGVVPVTCIGPAVDADVGGVVGIIRGGFEDGANEGVAVPVTRLIGLMNTLADAPAEDY